MMTRSFASSALLSRTCAVLVALTLAVSGPTARAAWIWVEGEKPVRSTMHRHPYWFDQVKRDQLSGGDLISNFAPQPGEATYRVNAPTAGPYAFWVRANPVQAKLAYKLNDGAWIPIDLDGNQRESLNIAGDGKVDLRFLAWIRVGDVDLKGGANTVSFRMDGSQNNHGYLDCFVLANESFKPSGALKPDEAARTLAQAEPGWFAFDPEPDPFRSDSGFDLRSLNEPRAGDGGFIEARGDTFIHGKTGQAVRFWAVNGPASKDAKALKAEARKLAKHGVNLARIHHGYYDGDGRLNPEEIQRTLTTVEALKNEGIYSHFSIYFPLWLTPKPDNPVLKGYDGRKHPFAALFFNPEFQELYRSWWKALLTTPNPTTGKALIDEPAVFGVEVQNEDSFFFWTFNPDAVPDAQLRILEAQFGAWLKREYGSIDKALAAWGNGAKVARDVPAEGRVGFRPLWNVANERTARDKDTVAFLAETQQAFYQDTYKFLRDLGFKGVITASNWITADPRVLTPIEKRTYIVGDFIDRHGYFSCQHKGDSAEWSIRDGHTYADRSALRFDPEQAGKPRVFAHPVMDPTYAGKPSMISETTFNRPNRYRSEAPLYYAAYGALQGTDAIVHFAQDGAAYEVKPRFFMQPWTLMSPAMMGQFPAAAWIYRKGLIAPGDVLAEIDLGRDALLDLEGTPLPQDAALDELRLKDVPRNGTERGSVAGSAKLIDPRIHYAGRVEVRFPEKGGVKAKVQDLSKRIDAARQVITSTHDQLRLDYGRGVLTLNAPSAQGVSGALAKAGRVETKDLVMSSPLELGHIVVVSLDDAPLAKSKRILVQVMSEEKASDFRTEAAGTGIRKIVSIGRDPWLVRRFEGTVRFKRPDASALKVTVLDPNGAPLKTVGNSAEWKLDPTALYYVVTAP